MVRSQHEAGVRSRLVTVLQTGVEQSPADALALVTGQHEELVQAPDALPHHTPRIADHLGRAKQRRFLRQPEAGIGRTAQVMACGRVMRPVHLLVHRAAHGLEGRKLIVCAAAPDPHMARQTRLFFFTS
jgi:hypothetical protein